MGNFPACFKPVRWNGFMAFAIAENLFPAEGVAIKVLTMAIIIPRIWPVCLLSRLWENRQKLIGGVFSFVW